MRRVEQLITQVRRATENTRVGTTDGLSDEEFVQYLNDIQEAIQNAVLAEHASAFHKDKTYTVTGAEEYTLPADCYGGQAVAAVWWSSDATSGSWRKLKQARTVERTSRTGLPVNYILRGNKFLVDAYPTTGFLRVTYSGQVRRLDKRRATITAITLASGKVTALTIYGTPFTQADYDLFPTISVVDTFGTVKMSGIPFTAVSALGVVTLDPASGFTYATGESAATGDYICLGTNASPTSELPEIAEKLLLKGASRVILDRDSSNDRTLFKEDEMDMLRQIVSFYGDVSQDLDQIPCTNFSYFDDLD